MSTVANDQRPTNNVQRFVSGQAPALRSALVTTVGCEIALLIVMAMHLPEPAWALITVFVLSTSSAGASILGMGYLLPFFYLLFSLKNGAIAGDNPWKATGLEWQTPSPPPTFNFDRTPFVTHGPYHYSPEADELEAAEQDVRRAQIEAELVRAEILADEARAAAKEGPRDRS